MKEGYSISDGFSKFGDVFHNTEICPEYISYPNICFYWNYFQNTYLPRSRFECPEKLSKYPIEEYLHSESPMDGLEEIRGL